MIPIIVVIEFALILKLYQIQISLKRTLTHRVAEFMTLATLAPTTTEALPLIDFKDTLKMETDLLYLLIIVLAIISISAIIHLIILFVMWVFHHTTKAPD